jgi:hypothetical protein
MKGLRLGEDKVHLADVAHTPTLVYATLDDVTDLHTNSRFSRLVCALRIT